MNLKLSSLLVFLTLSITIKSQINPATAYPELFKRVQSSEFFKDQKTFVDLKPIHSISFINTEYEKQKDKQEFNLEEFISLHFEDTHNNAQQVLKHIEQTWSLLTKLPQPQDSLSSLMALPYPYIVPGGRFQEIYYWDSYFTFLGLEEAGKITSIENMVDNFAWLITKFGHIPNGNRTYYLSRSQPPFFSLMVELLAKNSSDSAYIKYRSVLEKEYNFWMSGTHQLNDSTPNYKRAVQLNSDAVLNRYYDDLSTPRPESHLHDINTFEESQRDSTIYREIRAAAESGWDFSSRWLEDGKHLKTIHTTHIIPVDLNCLLYHLEKTLMHAYSLSHEKDKSIEFEQKATIRQQLIKQYCWNAQKGYFFDYNFLTKTQTNKASLAGIYPLFLKMVDQKTADEAIKTMEQDFLKKGGLVSTLENTDQQWDYPNGWAPLQWIGYLACKNYGHDSLATIIATRWLRLNTKVYMETGKMLEKYNVVNTEIEGGGGEYPLQDGFGWTNGVFLKLWKEENKP